LIRHRAVGITVTQHNAAGREVGPDFFADQLRPRRRREQYLGAGLHGLVTQVVQNVANLFTDFGAARFAGEQNTLAARGQMLGQSFDLRGFARTVGAFEGDEQAQLDLPLRREEGEFGHLLKVMVKSKHIKDF
jgi:hypothetical protein